MPFLVYYESIKRELIRKLIYECRCDERLKTKPEESTRLTYTGLIGELEHLKIKTRLIDERFASVMDECDRDTVGVSSVLKVIRSVSVLVRILTIFGFTWVENPVRRKWN